MGEYVFTAIVTAMITLMVVTFTLAPIAKDNVHKAVCESLSMTTAVVENVRTCLP